MKAEIIAVGSELLLVKLRIRMQIHFFHVLRKLELMSIIIRSLEIIQRGWRKY